MLIKKVNYILYRNFILVINLCALAVELIIQYQNIYCLLVCRIFQGVFIGNFMALVPVYINELSPK
jgi:MFS family permease